MSPLRRRSPTPAELLRSYDVAVPVWLGCLIAFGFACESVAILLALAQ